MWVEKVGEETLDEGRGMREVVGPAVGGEEESRNICAAGIVGGSYVVFEEVEEAEREDEEGEPPEVVGACLDEEQGDGDGEAEAEGCTEEECA